MEKLLKALDCTDPQKVRFATFKLIGEAERWWRSTKAILEGMDIERSPITWEKFKAMITTSLRVDNYAESVKRTMRLEEDFKNNVRKKNPPRNTGQTGFQQGNAQGHWNKKGSVGRSGSNSSSNKPENKNSPQNAQACYAQDAAVRYGVEL
ncbi:hypothetical protein SO802_010182 [Lithocarpus litseifolius]|uniref:Gag protein n=1 Tax=Lithocarpus litseifolius TaxID=425828 RepID=A0AAW2DHR5_9ROSI